MAARIFRVDAGSVKQGKSPLRGIFIGARCSFLWPSVNFCHL